MKKRVTVLMLSAVVLTLFIVPAAQAESILLSSMSPAFAYENSGWITTTVYGSFMGGASAPQFELRGPYYTLIGTTDTDFWDSSSAMVRFYIGVGMSDVYDLYVHQLSPTVPGTERNATLPSAFTITNPILAPHINYLDPNSTGVGNGDLSVIISGTGFLPPAYGEPTLGSRARWNDSVWLDTIFTSGSKISCTVPAAYLATMGYNHIDVVNPGPVYSSPRQFIVTTPPIPTLESLEPDTATAGRGDLTLLVHGNSFMTGPTGALVLWNGVPLSTTRSGPSLLIATVPATMFLAPGAASVTVRNGVDGGAPLSTALTFTVTGGGVDTPVITSLEPTGATAGGPAFDLIVHGSSFITGDAGSVVLWSGTALATTRTSTTQLTAAVPAGLIAVAGSASVTVRNGSGGAPLSNAVSFPIGSTSGPTLTSIDPSQVWAGYVGPAIPLIVNGSGFASGAHVWLGAVEKTATAFVGATQLTAQLLPADLVAPGTIMVRVTNPPAPGVASANALPLAVAAETTDPTVSIAGAGTGWHNGAVTLTVSGDDSQSGLQKVQYRCPPAVAAWTDGPSYTVPASAQGSTTVYAQALDWCNRATSSSTTVNIDTTKPTTDALNAVSVKRNKIAKLRFRIAEPANLSPMAKVVIRVKKLKGGKVVKTKTLNNVPMNVQQMYSFKVTLKKGNYRWFVYATDLAGNAQVNIDKASFKVR